MEDSKKLFRGLGFTGIALCAICCALPMVGMILGAGTLTLLAKYFEWAAIGALALSLVFFGVTFFRKKKAPACDVNCACKDEKNLVNGKSV